MPSWTPSRWWRLWCAPYPTPMTWRPLGWRWGHCTTSPTTVRGCWPFSSRVASLPWWSSSGGQCYCVCWGPCLLCIIFVSVCGWVLVSHIQLSVLVFSVLLLGVLVELMHLSIYVFCVLPLYKAVVMRFWDRQRYIPWYMSFLQPFLCSFCTFM